MRTQINRLAVVVSFVGLFAVVSSNFATAANVTWNIAGGGDWDTTTANWTGDSTFYTEGDAVTLNNPAGGVINLTANRTPASTTFSAASGTYTISGGNIAGGDILLPNGSGGTVVLNSQHTSVNSVRVGTGTTLRLGAAERINNSSTLGAYGHRGTLDMNNFDETINNLTGEVVFINSGTLTVSVGDRSGGYMTGNGALVKVGPGNLYFRKDTSDNTYTGGTFIEGSFQLYNSNDTLPSTGMVQVAVGATFNLDLYNNATQQTIGALNGFGTIKTSTTNASGTAFRVGNGGDSGIFSGVFEGNGSFTKLGGGTQVLNGNNTYTGTTTISDGKLVVNGITGPNQDDYTVQAGGILGGNGTINLDTGKIVNVLAGGALEPGNSAGTLTINGGLTLNDGSILNMELGSGGDTIVVNGVLTGSASSGGITLNLQPLQPYGEFVLLDWTGGSISDLHISDFNVNGAPGQLMIVGSQLLISVPVPEPATFTLLGLGLLAMLRSRRRRH